MCRGKELLFLRKLMVAVMMRACLFLHYFLSWFEGWVYRIRIDGIFVMMMMKKRSLMMTMTHTWHELGQQQ